MSQPSSPSAWCAEIQAKLMAALDAAWALIETSDDPAAIAMAKAKARVCGQLAGDARKIATMVPEPKAAGTKPRQLPIAIHEAFGRLDAGQPPAAQAVAMQAALRKLKRR